MAKSKDEWAAKVKSNFQNRPYQFHLFHWNAVCKQYNKSVTVRFKKEIILQFHIEWNGKDFRFTIPLRISILWTVRSGCRFCLFGFWPSWYSKTEWTMAKKRAVLHVENILFRISKRIGSKVLT